MKNILITMAMLLLTAVAVPAHAEDIEVSEYQCQQFMSSPEDIPYMIFWIDGYLSALTEQAVLSQDWMENLSGQITSFCQKNPTSSLMQAIEVVE